MFLSVRLKDALRPLRDIVYTFVGFCYDFLRYFNSAGWRKHTRISVRDYKAVKIYHRLEKSLSFRRRNVEAGWGAAADFVRHLEYTESLSRPYSFHERVGIKVLGDFVSLASPNLEPEKKRIVDFWNSRKKFAHTEGGAIEVSAKDLMKGKLQNPEQFFLSRYSVRDFSERRVTDEKIKRALDLALKSPSVCNRNAAFVYHLDTREQIDTALSLQNGNRGFGHEVNCLLLLCVDLAAFDTAGERYQHWIDGGMFSMSLVWALHALGLSSCCLNWSKGPMDDLKLRKLVKIKDEHTVLMMLAVGYAREKIKVCCSARKDNSHFYIKMV